MKRYLHLSRGTPGGWARLWLGALLLTVVGCGSQITDPSPGPRSARDDVTTVATDVRPDDDGQDAVTVVVTLRPAFTGAPGPLGQPAPEPALVAGGPQLSRAPRGGTP